MKRNILIIDDEECITRYLLRTLRCKEYDVCVANNGNDGLKFLEDKRIDLIISDMRMPGMTGYELLNLVKQKYPHTIRIILSGDSERDTIIKAVADGTAQSYLTKPISNDALKLHITRLFRTYDLLHQNSLLQIIKYIECLPVTPPIYNKLQLLINENKSIDEIAEFISNDPEYAAKILQIANSSLYGVRIGSISQAIVYLGLESVKQLVLGTDVFRTFLISGIDREAIDIIWKHSRMTNRIFHAIYKTVHNRMVPNEYTCCGLLHDIGLLMIMRYFPEQYTMILKKMNSVNCTLDQAETNVLGVNHTVLGAYLMDWWNLPQAIIETCLYHHDPLQENVQNCEICSMLHISDYYSLKQLGKEKYSKLVESTLGKFNIDENMIEETIKKSLNEEFQQDT